MCIGKPTIATAYSSTQDYMNLANSYPVRYRLIELKEDHGPYKKGGVWADPDLDHAATQMRRAFENPEEVRRIGQQAASDIQHLYSGEVLARKIISRLNVISSWSR
jgi:glycosyltransferase involved in cell wall biosynthesis